MTDYSVISRKGDSLTRIAAHQNLAEVGDLKAEFNACKAKVSNLEDKLQYEEESYRRLTIELDQAGNSLAEIEERIDMNPLPEGAQPVAQINERNQLRLRVKQMAVALEAQNKSVRKARESVRNAERKLFTADKKLNQFVDALEITKSNLALQSELDKARSDSLAIYEIKRANKWEKAQKEAIDARASQVQQLHQLAQNQITTTKSLHKEAASRVETTNTETMKVTRKIQSMKEKDLLNRIDAVLELKTNQDAVRASVASQAAKHVHKIKQAQQTLENEKASMIAAGLNPYAEFRRREIEENAIAKERALKQTVERNKAELAERLILEEEIVKKENSKIRKNKAYEKKYRDELGRHVIEDRNKQYIVDVTADHREILDPSGRESRVDPSKITDIPDYSFGLGKSSRIPAESMKRITERIRSTMKVEKDELGEYMRLVKELQPAATTAGQSLRSTSAPGGLSHSIASTTVSPRGGGGGGGGGGGDSITDSTLPLETLKQLQSLANTTGATPGASGAAVAINLEGEVEKATKLLKIAAQEVDGDPDAFETNANLNESPKYKLTKLSKFEEDAFARAKERQLKRQVEGTVQIAAGQVFQGASFVSKPAQIEYIDFEVGKVYRKKFIMTNVSYTFNSFRLVAFSDDVIDFFEIAYDKPGRMSAGVSCTLNTSFSPKINSDITTCVKFLTETGPVEVPLICRKRRCLPEVITTEIDCGTLVVGQKNTFPLRIINKGSLPSNFTITKLVEENQEDLVVAVTGDENQEEESDDDDDDEKNAQSSEAQSDTVGPLPRGGGGGPAATATTTTMKPDGDEEALQNGKADSRRRFSRSTTASGEGEEEGDYLSSEPALQEAELLSRVRRRMTKVSRRKLREHPHPLSVASTTTTITANNGGLMMSVPGYGETTIMIICAPMSAGLIRQRFAVEFEGVENNNTLSPRDVTAIRTKSASVSTVDRIQYFTASVVGEEIPIYVAEEVIDLKCTLIDRIYRRKVELRNRGTTACKVVVKIPSPLNKFVDISPMTVFVQSEGSQSLNLKFAPTKDLSAKLAHYTVKDEHFENTVMLAVPVEVKVVGQELPVFFVLRSHVCPSTLRLSTSSLDFGNVYVSQRVTAKLRVTNTSRLTQKIAFTKFRKEISIQPNDGFGTLLPNESMTFDITLSPLSVVTYSFGMTILTSFNDTYTINVRGQGVDPPVILVDPVIHMRTTCPGERVVESTVLKNQTNSHQIVEIGLPDSRYSWLKISPSVVELAPKASCRIEMQYLPPDDLMDVDPVTWHDSLKPLAPSPFPYFEQSNGWVNAHGPLGEMRWASYDSTTGNVYDSEDDENSSLMPSENEWAVTSAWNLPIWIGSANKSRLKSATTSSRVTSSEEKEKMPAALPLFFSVHTTVMCPLLMAEEKVIDFGQASVGTRQVKSVKIRNLSSVPIELSPSTLNAVGPFMLLNAIRRLEPESWQQVIIECLPKSPGLIVEVLEIGHPDGSGHRARITLKSYGVNPVVDISGLDPGPPGWSTRGGLLDFGNVVINDCISKKFTIENKSAFAVVVAITSSICEGLPASKHPLLLQRTMAGLPVFSIRPEKATIEPEKSLDVEIMFRPDRGRVEPFREDINVIVGQGDEPIPVGICGRSWRRQMFVTTYDARDDIFARVLLANGSEAEIEDAYAVNNALEVRKLSYELKQSIGVTEVKEPQLLLEFPDPFTEDKDWSIPDVIEAPPATGSGAKAPKGEAVTGRSLTRGLVVHCAKISDVRPGASAGGSFEILLSQVAKDSSMFMITTEKGNVAVGSSVQIDITCTLPRPKGLGGLQIGSWQTFTGEVILKGGWKLEGEFDEFRVPFCLKAFVRL